MVQMMDSVMNRRPAQIACQRHSVAATVPAGMWPALTSRSRAAGRTAWSGWISSSGTCIRSARKVIASP